MKKYIKLFAMLAALIIAGLVVPVRAADTLYPDRVMVARSFTDSAGTELPYRVYIPPTADTDKPLPLLLYLHGSGHRGSDNTVQVAGEPGIIYRVLNSDNRDCVIVAPQCADGEQWVDTPWADGSYNIGRVGESRYLHAVYELLRSLSAELPVDSDRIYVTGISMGGYGTWDLILRYPELFAAAVPICGAGDPSKAEVIAGLPIWCFHGNGDDVVPVSGTREMAEALEAAGNAVFTYTEYPGVGHACWTAAYSEPELVDWMFAQSRNGASVPPGNDKNVAFRFAGWAAAAVIIAASGFAIYQSVRLKTKRNGGCS